MGDSDNESGGLSAKEQERLLPIANVSRIMKKGLPANGKISKEAKETVQECVSEFISFITGEASDKCQREKRKTINGDDLLWAVTTLGFEDYVEPLKIYLLKYREMEGDKTSSMGRQGEKEPANNNLGDGAGSDNGMYGGMTMNMMMGHYQGHVYGSGGFHHVGIAASASASASASAEKAHSGGSGAGSGTGTGTGGGSNVRTR